MNNFLLLTLLIMLADMIYISAVAPVNSVPMKVVNNAGAPIELFWINAYAKKGSFEDNLVLQTTKPIRNSSDTSINSYDTHQFLAKFLTHKEGIKYARFTKGPREETVTITYDETNNEMLAIQTTQFDTIRQTIKDSTITCSKLRGDLFSECIANAIIDDVTVITDSKSKITKYRDLIASRLRNYTCDDESMESTEPIETKFYSHGNKKFKADIMLNMDSAKIMVVHDVITSEECDVLMNHGGPRLKRATVAAEDGTSVVSENRKAQQASYTLNQLNPSTDPLTDLYNRVLSITNQHAGYQLQPEGQEDFTIIQYNVADQYTSHCDGSCDNSKHISGGRVATAVLYCKVADRGGGTTFTKADVFVKPRNGDVTIFSYKNMKDGRMDEGYTEHSGCPVLEGEKWITTMWMREGVTKEDTWVNFDPSGIRMMSEEEQKIADEKSDFEKHKKKKLEEIENKQKSHDEL